jgi:hypothetical protein
MYDGKDPLARVVDLERYPLHDPQSEQFIQLLDTCRWQSRNNQKFSNLLLIVKLLVTLKQGWAKLVWNLTF